MKKLAALLVFMVFLLSVPTDAYATPIIKKTKTYPVNCYYHYDGKIWIYSTSGYRTELKKAVKLLNRKYNVFRITRTKNKRDVWIRDKKQADRNTVLAYTTHRIGQITLYRKTMKRISKADRTLVIAHELCHAAGIDHSSSRKSLMYPYVNRLKTRTLSKGDVQALKRAKAFSVKENKKRRKVLKELLDMEASGKKIGVRFRGLGIMVLAFPKRGTTYHSSDPSVLEVYPTGVLLSKKPGEAVLTVNNAGSRHRFHFVFVEVE